MLFNSLEFFIFFPIVFALYWLIPREKIKFQNALLLIASFVFYGWWSWEFAGLLLGLIALNFYFGIVIENGSKHLLWFAVTLNLGVLALFKYCNFFIDQAVEGFQLLKIPLHLDHLKLILPIGISFYTFHGLSYIFDIYRKQIKPTHNWIDYSLFVSFFPLLVAGPIERASHFLPQIQSTRKFSKQQSIDGVKLMVWGMFKKIVIADNLATIANYVFNGPQNCNSLTLLIGAMAFSIQIYGDFSGYSDIAIGTAKLFGFELLSNFKFPYFSRDIAEFWRRWHISLSSWFRDYLYIPLGGSKLGKLKSIRNTFIIFLVSGFWHGASWNFIIWGGLHALAFLPLLLLNKNRQNSKDIVAFNSTFPEIKELLQMVGTFLFATFAWVFFRAKSIGSALLFVSTFFKDCINMPSEIFHGKHQFQSSEHSIVWFFVYSISLILGDWMLRRNERSYKIPFYLLVLIWAVVLIYFVMSFGKNLQFIYFQF